MKQLCYDLLSEYKDRATSENENNISGLSSSSFAPCTNEDSGNRSSADSSQTDMYSLFKQTKKRTVNAISELDRYLDDESLPDCDSFDILNI